MATEDGCIRGEKVERYRSFDRLRAAAESGAELSIHIDRDLAIWAVQEIQRLRMARDLAIAQMPFVRHALCNMENRLREVCRDGD